MESTFVPTLPNKDDEHLRLLALFHYIVGGLAALFACLPLIHVGMGIMMLRNPEFLAGDQKGAPPPAAIGYLFIFLSF